MTPCPLNGNCVYNHSETGANFCGRSKCAYPKLQRKELIKEIVRLHNKDFRTTYQEIQLKRYRAYLKRMV